jgi:hypothetical protein
VVEAVDEEVYAVVVAAAVDIAWVQGEIVVEEGGVSLVVVLVGEMMSQVAEVEEKPGVVGEGLVEEKI